MRELVFVGPPPDVRRVATRAEARGYTVEEAALPGGRAEAIVVVEDLGRRGAEGLARVLAGGTRCEWTRERAWP